jgi:hypothetical protein
MPPKDRATKTEIQWMDTNMLRSMVEAMAKIGHAGQHDKCEQCLISRQATTELERRAAGVARKNPRVSTKGKL